MLACPALLVPAATAASAPVTGDCVVPHRLGVVFVLDDSGSMATSDPGRLRGAAVGSGIDALPDGSVVAASTFSDEATRAFAPTGLDAASRDGLKGAASGGLEDSGGTDYDAAFTEAKAQLDAMPDVDKRAVVFLSDGEPNYSYSADGAIDAAGVPIFSIGFGAAPGAELSGIATRSGGQAFALSSASQAPEIFARIVSTLSCDLQQSDVSLTLKPGERREFPFRVAPDLPGFHALATWSGGELRVTLVRPDGSTLDASSLEPGERFDQSPTSASVAVAKPRPGRWKLRVTAAKAAARDVHVHIDNWERGRPGQTSSEDPRGAPKPTGEPGCRGKVSFHGIEAEAGCFKLEHGVFSARGRIRVDGLDVTPKGDVTIELDPLKQELKSTGTVTVQAGSLTLYEGKLEKSLQGHVELPVPKAVSKLKGFPLTGNASVSFENGVGTLELTVAIKQLGNVTGSATLTASNAAGLQIAKAAIDLKEAKIKAIPIKDVHLGYESTEAGDKWSGSAKVELPSPTVQSVSGGASFIGGSFAEGHGAVDGSLPIAEAVFLTHLDASLQLKPSFAFGGGMGVSAGPKIADVRAVGVDGHFDFAAGAKPGDPDDYKLSGDVKVADRLTLANGSIDYKTDGQLELKGNLSLAIKGVGFDGDVGGFANGNGFEVTGDGRVGYHGHGIGGNGIVSSTGLAACAKLFFGDVGFGIKWRDYSDVHIFGGSCDLGDWTVARGARASAPLGPGASASFRLARGMPLAAFSAVGVGGPPNVTLTGPGGVRVGTPPSDAGLVSTHTSAAFANPEDDTTYLAVARPAPGTWTVHVEPGSPAVSDVRTADGLPLPDVHARVTGAGRERRLAFSARANPGQRLVFFERGAGVGAQIGATSKARGSLTFRPFDASARRRQIVVEVQQNGLVRSRAAIGSYVAPPPLHPRRVGRLAVVRGAHHSALVRWSAAPGAARYELRVAVSDGRRLLFTRTGRQRTVRVGGIVGRRRLRVTVVPISRAGRAGTARTERGPMRPHRRPPPVLRPPYTG
jgi:hypothetical protein